MLEHEETMRLIKLAQQGDEDAKTQLIEHNTPLIKSIVRRYLGRNVEYDDLFQISGVGLLKAIYNFSPEYNVRFSTYAVPMILGEVKRFLRDDGYIKVSRTTKSQAAKIAQFVDNFRKESAADPTVEQIAAEFGIEPSEVVFVMDSARQPLSLYDKNDADGGKSLSLIDKLSLDEKDDDMVDKVILKTVIDSLTPREKKIIMMRYFRDMTQGEIAALLGVSQVQVSRLESKILDKIRQGFAE